jgi:membrane protease subunit (stomatin/prohibitin family)
MGLISAALGAASSTLRDQWKEYFYVDALPSDVIAVKAQHHTSGLFGGNKGNDNIITAGSGVVVADGQCAVIVENGVVAEICAQPGEYTYDNTVAPSVFSGDLGDAVKASFAEIGKRFTYGGQTAADQRIYYFNTKEMTGNKFGTPNPIPFRVVDQRAGIDIDVSIKCFGEYSFRVVDPVRFYTNNAGNFQDEYTVEMISDQMRSELLNALQPAFAKISEEGIRYSALPGRTKELCTALKEELKDVWGTQRGMEIQSIAVSSVTADAEDEKMLKQMQRNAAYTNPNLAAATLVGAQAQAMQDAANNPNGAMNGFVGMNMAQNAGGINANNLYAQGAASNNAGTPAQEGEWYCPNCGTKNTGNFCTNCGTKKPE